MRDEIDFSSEMNFQRVESIKSRELERENRLVDSFKSMARSVSYGGVRRKSIQGGWYQIIHNHVDHPDVSIDHDNLDTTMRSGGFDDSERIMLLK